MILAVIFEFVSTFHDSLKSNKKFLKLVESKKFSCKSLIFLPRSGSPPFQNQFKVNSKSILALKDFRLPDYLPKINQNLFKTNFKFGKNQKEVENLIAILSKLNKLWPKIV